MGNYISVVAVLKLFTVIWIASSLTKQGIEIVARLDGSAIAPYNQTHRDLVIYKNMCVSAALTYL